MDVDNLQHNYDASIIQNNMWMIDEIESRDEEVNKRCSEYQYYNTIPN